MRDEAADGDPPATGRVTVLGLGNVLMGDDGFGPFVARQFHARYDYPEWVSVTDAGTPGLDLIPLLDEATAVVVVDTIRLDEPPGTLRLYRREHLLAVAQAQRLSPHDPGLLETLQTLEFRGGGPSEVLLVGVVPESCELGPGLSVAARGAAERAVAALADQLRQLGVSLQDRQEQLDPGIWWERSAGIQEGEP